jgi:thiamine-phosphate pyrophosphorylase
MESLTSAQLYGILDLGYVPEDRAAATARELIRGGVSVIQLRGKGWLPSDLLPVARSVSLHCAEAGVPLIINDYPELVPLCGASGVHVGQDDLPVGRARELAGAGAIVGKSTHSPDQAVAAASEGADYIGFGPLFATATKPDYPAIGLEDIARVHGAVRIPVFCIGGIKPHNLADVLAAGARRVVIVSALLQAEDIAATCRSCLKVLRAS